MKLLHKDILKANSCKVKIATFLDENGEVHEKITEIKCGCCNTWQDKYHDQMGEWTCINCGQLYNTFGQKLARSAWNMNEY